MFSKFKNYDIEFIYYFVIWIDFIRGTAFKNKLYKMFTRYMGKLLGIMFFARSQIHSTNVCHQNQAKETKNIHSS